MDRADGPVALADKVFGPKTKGLWVFAYGSLCYKPGFSYHMAVLGYVKGFRRKFWQGNTTHRGTPDKPGRVATLVEDSEGIVYGIAFAISGDAALPYLSNRECQQGGYDSKFTEFYSEEGEPFKVLLYIALPTNPHWLGDSDLEEMAYQISRSKGESGHNVEYLIRLADFMRHHFHDKPDSHLYSLEERVLDIVRKEEMCLKTLMGSGEGCVVFVQQPNSRESSPSQERRNPEDRVETFEHTARVPGKKLRCLNI